MAHHDDTEKVYKLAKDIGTCMYITHDGARWRARPMHAYVEADERAVYFLTDAESAKTHQTQTDQQVTLAFLDDGKHSYVSIYGRAEVTDDRAKIHDLWNVFAKAWWESADDPAIRLIKVFPDEAEYWDSPNGPVATIKMLAAAATGKTPDMGDHAKVNL